MAIEKAKITKEDFEKTVLDLAKKGMTTEKIGLELKKQGIKKAKKDFGVRISSILKKHNIYTSPEKQNVTKTIDTLKKHITKNHHDYSARRALITHESRIRKIK
jgi:ribosomal protein S15P/S13E